METDWTRLRFLCHREEGEHRKEGSRRGSREARGSRGEHTMAAGESLDRLSHRCGHSVDSVDSGPPTHVCSQAFSSKHHKFSGNFILQLFIAPSKGDLLWPPPHNDGKHRSVSE